MRTLVIDCATEACSVALFDDAACIAGEWRLLGRGHAEDLVPMIAALPGKGRSERVVVSLGPGSFTGIRVGIAAARALALAWQAEIFGYPTLALIAAQALAASKAPDVCVATTGGHGEWFVQAFAADGSALTSLASVPPDLAATSAVQGLVAGTQAAALVTARGAGEALDLLPDAREFALLNPAVLTPSIAPLYGRAPDARLPGGKLPPNILPPNTLPDTAR